MLKQAVICNACGAERKESNHWFALELVHDAVGSFIAVGQLTEALFTDAQIEHLCGETCVTKRVSALLPTLSHPSKPDNGLAGDPGVARPETLNSTITAEVL